MAAISVLDISALAASFRALRVRRSSPPLAPASVRTRHHCVSTIRKEHPRCTTRTPNPVRSTTSWTKD